MGSTTRDAIAVSRAALAAWTGTVDLAAAEELLAAGCVIGDSRQLLAVLADSSSETAVKGAAIRAVFDRSLSTPVIELLTVVVGNRWSNEDDLLAGIDELGFRAAASSAGDKVAIEDELFAFVKAVRSNAELELALGSKLGDPAAKVALVDRLLTGKVSAQTLVIVRHLVRQPRGRRINALVSRAAAIVADQAGFDIATVTTTQPIGEKQRVRLQAALAQANGRQVRINQVIDAEIVGGARVQIGDNIIDDSVVTRLQKLRLQLAG